MSLTPELMDFVRAAVRLPEHRLKAVDQAWEKLYPHRAVVTDLAQREGVLSDLIALREYVLAEARRVVAERPEEAVEGRHSVRRLTNPLSFPGTAG